MSSDRSNKRISQAIFRAISARRKRNSATLEQSERRIESLRFISETLDLGGGLTLTGTSTATAKNYSA